MAKIEVVGAKAPVWADHENTAITLLVRFSHMPSEEILFTASPNDAEEHGRELFAYAKFGKYGKVSACIAPTKEKMLEDSFPVRKQLALEKVEKMITPLARAARLELASKEELAELNKLEIFSIELMRSNGPTLPTMQ